MNKTQRAAIIITGIIFLVGLALVLFLSNRSSDKPDDAASSTSDKKAGQKVTPGSAPKPPTDDNPRTQACDIFGDALASQIIGNGAVKDASAPAIYTPTYYGTHCTYKSDNKTANIILYEYENDENAKSNEQNAKSQVVVPSADGRSTSVQPRQSETEVKGKYVVSAAVTVDSTFDSETSKQLLEETVKKL